MAGVSKVTLNGETLMDVTGTSVDTDNLLYGETALRNNGDSITGAVVTAEASDTAPAMDGTASAGSASTYSRGDHVHPTDTSRQATITASGILKGNGSGTVTAAVAGTDYAAASHNQALSTITGADDLKAIEALTGTSGLLKKTAANTWGLDTSSYLTSESDPVFAASAAHSISSTDISNWNAKAEVSDIPTDVSELNNDAGYITGYTETDPTVPSWAKASSKPTYTASEVGASASDHVHGNITNGGDITATATIASGDRLVINDESASKVTNSSITFGSSTTTFLTNKGTWATPSGAVTSVNGSTGAVTLDAADVGALPDNTTIPQGTVTSVRVQATNPVQSSTSTAQTATLNTTISLADGYGDTKNPYASKTKNTVLAAPSTANGTPSFRALVAADIPTLTKSKISDFPTAVSEFTNDAGYITGYTETDPTVPSWAKAASKPTYTASEVGALPSNTSIPSKTSDLTNDSGFITASAIPQEVFTVETTTNTQQGVITANKTFAEITAAHAAKKFVVDIHDSDVVYPLQYINSTAAIFVNPTYTSGHPYMQFLQVTSADAWSWFSAETTCANIGALPLSGGTMTGQLTTSFGAVAMGTIDGGNRTLPELAQVLRYSNGVAGSFYLNTAYEINQWGVNIPVSWYNFFWIPHRTGGLNGAASGDNCDYGALYLADMTGDNGVYEVRFTNGAIAAVRRLDNVDAGSWIQPTYTYRGVNYAIDWTIGSGTTGAVDANGVTGNYCGYYGSNGPSTAIGASTGDGALWTQAYSSAWMCQIAGDYRTGNLFVRGKNNGTFTAWKKIVSTTELNRTTGVADHDGNYTTLMARGESLNTTDTTPAVNGAIAWTYS